MNEFLTSCLSINPICSESYGVRSFCIKVTTPDIHIILDPGCALGPFKQYKIPHPLEYERLHQFSNEIIRQSQDCTHIFISHYHHDHFKPLMEEKKYIHTSKKIFESLYGNKDKMVFCKQYRNNTNYNQKQRGLKFHMDLEAYSILSYRIGVDKILGNTSIYYRNLPTELRKEITDSLVIGETHLIFPREFQHGIRKDHKEIFIQPLIIIHKNEFFYFFPDVQGMPLFSDLDVLIKIKKQLNAIYKNFDPYLDPIHIIALGGPITYILRHQKLIHLLEQSISHTHQIIQNFDFTLLDHHLLRDEMFLKYWKEIHTGNGDLSPFNRNLFSELENESSQIPVLECYREKLYHHYPL
ncbi:MAG: hypothetical protein JW776_08915 [Candidatus Lokiarchaeota archaeon]|nr:hypothetical protein [Candidatus Lokiarchaeota archaeon]